MPFDYRSCARAQLETFSACIQARKPFSVCGWTLTISNVPKAADSGAPTNINYIKMDNVCSGSFSYTIQYRSGQSLTLGHVKGTTHPAGLLDPKFRKMIPFVKVEGKPNETSNEAVRSVCVCMEQR